MTLDLADALGTLADGTPGRRRRDPAERAGSWPATWSSPWTGSRFHARFASYWQTHGLGERLVLSVLRKGAGRTIEIQVRPEPR